MSIMKLIYTICSLSLPEPSLFLISNCHKNRSLGTQTSAHSVDSHSCVVNLSLYGKLILSVNNWPTFTSLLQRPVKCLSHGGKTVCDEKH